MEMPTSTIIPPPRVGPPVASAGAASERYVPVAHIKREVDEPRPSAFPEERRFSTIYPGTQASNEATNAAFMAARRHDRSSSSSLLDVLYGLRNDDTEDDED